MDFILVWASLLIGILALIISLIIYRASRIGPRPVYQFQTLRLIGKGKQALPEEVQILFKGRSVPQLTRTHVILWNSGNAMLDGKNIIKEDPLGFEYKEGVEILRASILKVTRDSNKFTANIDPDSTNKVFCSFDYLESGDGAVIELLHTGEESNPEYRGTIRGVPKGLLDWGHIRPSRRRVRPSKKLRYFAMLTLFSAGVIMICSGLFLPRIFGFEESIMEPRESLVIVFSGLAYVFFPLLILWSYRRRFPKSLAIEDIEE